MVSEKQNMDIADALAFAQLKRQAGFILPYHRDLSFFILLLLINRTVLGL